MYTKKQKKESALLKKQFQKITAIQTAAEIQETVVQAAADKEKRDHRNENARRAKAGLPSLEEEALAKAKEEAERKATQGYQRQQPVRKRKKK